MTSADDTRRPGCGCAAEIAGLREALDSVSAQRDRLAGGAELEAAIAALEGRADRVARSRPTHEPNRRLVAHLARERDALFAFLRRPGVPATNHEAERAIRPQVCARKNWGGNKSERGARAHAVTGSVLRSATQQGLDPVEVLMGLPSITEASAGERLQCLSLED